LKKYYLIICLLTIYISGYSQLYTGTIIRVIDGDTFAFQTAEGSLVIRMYGIDAPERDQTYSKESSDFLKQYLNKEAIIKASGVDRYGRTLGILYINNQDINLLLIKRGCAWHFKRYSSDQQYADAESYARKNKIGLWKVDNPIPPWEWRKK
jgi:endonuclease YncB( thermonuclease family)